MVLKITLVFLEPAVGLRIGAENILGLFYNNVSWHLSFTGTFRF